MCYGQLVVDIEKFTYLTIKLKLTLQSLSSCSKMLPMRVRAEGSTRSQEKPLLAPLFISL